MKSWHVCSRCCHTIVARLRYPVLSSLQVHRSFISLSKPPVKNEQSVEDLLALADPGNGQNRRRPSRALPAKRRRPLHPDRDNVDMLEEFFQKGPQEPTSRLSPNANTDGSRSLEQFRRVEELKKMVKENAPFPQIWQSVLAYHSLELQTSQPRPSAFPSIMSRIRKRHVDDLRAELEVPSMSEVANVWRAFGLLNPKMSHQFLHDSLSILPDAQQSLRANLPSSEPSVSRQDEERRQAWAKDHLKLWRVVLSPRSLVHSTNALLSEREFCHWRFPDTVRGRGIARANSRSFQDSFQSTFSPQHSREVSEMLSATAVNTFATFVDNSMYESLKRNAFLAGLARLLAESDIRPLELDTFMKSFNYSLTSCVSVIQSARKENQSSDPGVSGSSTNHPPREVDSNRHKALSKAVSTRDLAGINKLWFDLRFDSLNDGPKDQGLLNRFIMAYMALRQSDRAVEVWNHMISISLEPTQSSWNAMLEGCKLARQSVPLERIWNKMIESGAKPDMVCWTTRISGLIECGQPDKAIDALQEMGRTWVRAVKGTGRTHDLSQLGDIDETIKPTVQTINAAISGLLKRRNQEAVNRVLAWGGQLGIQPDLFTFNILLRPLVRDGNSDAVKALLNHMQQQGLKPDVATFTTILDETFQPGKILTASQQSDLVNSTFAEMKAAGVKANHRTFAKILYSLLQTSDGDLSAVEAVLLEMTKQGLAPTSHIYTMLIEYHFAQEEPDLEAVRWVIDHARRSGIALDHIFWDRIIEGYARLGQTAMALTVMGREDREGTRVGWGALKTVLEALRTNQEWGLARQVVENTRKDRGPPPLPDEKGIDSQHGFWEVAFAMGLVQEET